ncbi:phosphatase PAP2 family protein [Chryseobacterium sp. MP_3.2]|uniref:phosphatase PAP2 family protein n=1 Tax=Chryseobacterium sp. MP_3.2 TaxID=3071712 RepID=UPI002E0BDD1F|nr:undecaprenyl-diphosphatase [Chryseobacterium sp. MP_3.2]
MIIQAFKNYYRSLSPKIIISLLFFIASLFVLFVITDEIVIEKEEDIDFQVFKFFKTYIVKANLTDFMATVTNFASVSFMMGATALLIIILLFTKNHKKANFTAFTLLGGLLLIATMKFGFVRPRPPYPLLHKEETFSFPSGHATFSFIFYGTLAYFVWLTDLLKSWKYIIMTLLICLSLLIGLSRIYLRVHYASDVLGGFCLGYSWLFLMIYVYRKWWPLT